MNQGVQVIQQDVLSDNVNLENTMDYSNVNSKKYAYRFVKRSFDLVLSTIGLLFLLPVVIIVKIINICSGDFGRVFFTQDRIGKKGKPFKFFKFRSMIPDADKALEELLKSDPAAREEYELNKKLKNDPRITKAGRFLRHYSLDELPQLINIFLGQMSFIGNRPYLPRESEDMGMYYYSIVSTKPGLTGYWQVSGRSDLSFQKRLQLEKYYSEHCGLKMDIKIFFKTFKVVLFGKGSM